MLNLRDASVAFVVSFVALSALLAEAETNDEATGEPQIETLIEQLGDDSFHTREQAMAELIELGPPAEPHVQDALEAADPEVTYRARKILKEIDRSQIAQRREAFLAGDVDQLKANAASWKRMEELVGNTREARELFLQMQIAGEKLLTAAEEDPRRCAQDIAQLYTEDQNARRFGGGGIPAGAVAAMVLIGSDDRVSLDSSAISRSTSLLYRHRATLGDNDVFKQLLGKWVSTKSSGTMQYQFLRLAQQFKLPEGIELARKMATGGGSTSYKAQALLTIGMLGGEDDLELLESLVEDDARVGSVARSGKKRIECKVGDIALAMALALTDQNAKEYGFPNAPNGRPTSTSYYNYGFIDDESRQAAREKWQEYKEQQQ